MVIFHSFLYVYQRVIRLNPPEINSATLLNRVLSFWLQLKPLRADDMLCCYMF
jgi:hypothetical protein